MHLYFLGSQEKIKEWACVPKSIMALQTHIITTQTMQVTTFSFGVNVQFWHSILTFIHYNTKISPSKRYDRLCLVLTPFPINIGNYSCCFLTYSFKVYKYHIARIKMFSVFRLASTLYCHSFKYFLCLMAW